MVVLTTFGEDDNVFAALRLGALGFLLKDAGPLLAKLGVRDRVGLVVLAYESGLVRPGGGGTGREG